MNTIDNLQNIAITLLVFAFGIKAITLGFKKTFMIIQIISFVILVYLWTFFPTSLMPIIITNFLLGVLQQWDFLAATSLCAYFPETGTTGMLYTMNASGSNFGRNLFIHTALLKKVPWRTAALVGLVIQVVLIFVFTPKMMDLVEGG